MKYQALQEHAFFVTLASYNLSKPINVDKSIQKIQGPIQRLFFRLALLSSSDFRSYVYRLGTLYILHYVEIILT